MTSYRLEQRPYHVWAVANYWTSLLPEWTRRSVGSDRYTDPTKSGHQLSGRGVSRWLGGGRWGVVSNVVGVLEVVPPLLKAAADVSHHAWRILAGQEHVVEGIPDQSSAGWGWPR